MRVASARIVLVVTLALLPALVVACSSVGQQGSLLGSVTGSTSDSKPVKGQSRVVTTAGRAVIGGIASNEVGRQMSDRERGIVANAEYRALEYGRSGAPTAWNYPATSHRGSIVPGRPYQKGSQYCRTYTHTITRTATPEIVKGTACRDPDGTWRSVG